MSYEPSDDGAGGSGGGATDGDGDNDGDDGGDSNGDVAVVRITAVTTAPMVVVQRWLPFAVFSTLGESLHCTLQQPSALGGR